MLIPTVISPEDLVPPGEELDALRKVTCICQNTVMLGATKLVWWDFGDGEGWRAVCGQACYINCFAQGRN